MKKKRAKKLKAKAAPVQPPHAIVKPPTPAISKRPAILELEEILNAEGDTAIEILPNGEVRAASAEEVAKRPKPITLRENLGGEYGEVA